jgi:hypothetical protein
MIELVIHALLTRQEDNGELARTIHVDVRCEQCRSLYGYALTRSVPVKASRIIWESAVEARKEAFKRAERMLKRKLDREHDPVPCPECGWLQKRMLDPARREHFPLLPRSAKVAFILAGVMVACYAVATLVEEKLGVQWPQGDEALILSLLLMLACGVVTVLVHRVRAFWFDPNSTPIELRRERGLERALTWEEFALRYPEEDEEGLEM